MPVYKATIQFKGRIEIEYEAMGDAECGDIAAEVFDEMSKGRLEMADIEITDINANRMSAVEIDERSHDTDERV